MKQNDSVFTPSSFLFGAAYYDEYMPYHRIDEDFQLMKEAGMNVIRIGESTWSTYEPTDGCFDFTSLHRMLDGAKKYDLKVIIGTPTYAIPSWLYKKHPDILTVTKNGPALYGARQLIDITNETFLFYAERIINKMLSECATHPNVIGYQIDNETRSADAAGINTQRKFLEYIKELYPNIEEFNSSFGLDYWSNKIGRWEDFPDIRGTINGSLSAAYKRFLRKCISDYHSWQTSIIKKYAVPGQFITHNFDYEWRDYSHGLQPLVDQVECAKYMDIAGCDIYYLTQDDFNGSDISFCGAVARSLKKGNYLILETHSQGKKPRLPYPGQQLQAIYSHIACGAVSTLFWNWHSIHNSFESYWKGILSHDLIPSRIYHEIKSAYTELTNTLPYSVLKGKGLTPLNEVALIVDHASLDGIDEFPFDEETGLNYNDVVRTYFDAAFELNIHCDIVYPGDDLSNYKLLIVPALYSVKEETVLQIRDYISSGGHVLMSFKSCFSDHELKIFHDAQPHNLTDICGFTYDEFTIPQKTEIVFEDGQTYIPRAWIELLRVNNPSTQIWGRYKHKYWKDYAAITHNSYKNGSLTYIGSYLEKDGIKNILGKLITIASLDIPSEIYPIICKKVSDTDSNIYNFVFNYSEHTVSIKSTITNNKEIELKDWETIIIKKDNQNEK